MGEGIGVKVETVFLRSNTDMLTPPNLTVMEHANAVDERACQSSAML